MAIDTERSRLRIIDRVKAAGGLPIPLVWPGTTLQVTAWERSLIRMAQHRGELPPGPIMQQVPWGMDEVLSGDDRVLEVIKRDEPADLPYEVTPAILALRERKKRLGR